MKGQPGELVLGRYVIERQIGRGGFGRVYLAKQVALSRYVAIKCSSPEQRTDLAMRERFRREAVLVAAINHPNVVIYHDFGTDEEGDMVLVMEYLRGVNLREALASPNFRPTPLWIAEVIRQAAEGLEAAHRAGIVHRDVKPSNLFLVRPGASSRLGQQGLKPPSEHFWLKGTDFLLKVIDFGILRVDAEVCPDLPDLTASDAILGTPTYIAPEMLAGLRPDPRADQYALALVALEMFSGRRAFGGARDPSGFMSRLSRLPPELDHLPQGPREVLARALSPVRDERFATITEFARALLTSLRPERQWQLLPRPTLHEESTSPTVVEDSTPTKREDSGPTTLKPRPGKRPWMRFLWALPAFATLGGLLLALALLAWPERASQPQQPEVFLTRRSPEGPTLSPPSQMSPFPFLTEEKGPTQKQEKKDQEERRPRRRINVEPPQPGFLTINARPWAEVYLDGVHIGRTPVMKYQVPKGLHTIRFVHPNLGERTVQRAVRAGDDLIVTVNLLSEDPPNGSKRLAP